VNKLLKNYLNTEKTTGFERRVASFTNSLIPALNLEPTLLAQRLFALFVNKSLKTCLHKEKTMRVNEKI